MPRLRLAMAQTNPTVGDRLGNVTALLAMARTAYDQGAQVFLTGELALTGYPIEDLALRNNFLALSDQALHAFAHSLQDEGMGDMAVIVGHPSGPHDVDDDPKLLHSPARAQNRASVLLGGVVAASYAKHHLPN